MAMVMPSLSGSSDMSSGVISGFRRALVWADGGGGDGAAEVAAEATRCPSVVSSLNEIPGRCAAYPGRDPGRDPGTSETRTTLELATAAFSSDTVTTAGAGGDANGEDGGCGWKGKGAAGVAAAAAATGGDDELERGRVNRQLTWRWPELCGSTADAGPAAARSTPPLPPTHGYDGDKSNGASGCDSGTGDALGGGDTTISPEAKDSRGALETSPLKPPRGSYLRRRDKTVVTIQENLHAALDRLADAIREQVDSVSSKPAAEEIVRGPKGGEPPERYYEASTRRDFRDFFDQEEEEASRLQQPKAYAYLGALREIDKAKYVFDRTSHGSRKGSLAAHLWGDYEPRPEGYRGTNVHSATDWRRSNTTLDRYSSSGREAMERIAESDKELVSQGAWVRDQTRAREHRRQRANHMLEVYRSELLKEQSREIEVLRLGPREQRLHAARTMQDQIVAADRIMRTIKRYGLAGNMEDAHYVRYAAGVARRAGLSPVEVAPPTQPQPPQQQPSTAGSTGHLPEREGGCARGGKGSGGGGGGGAPGQRQQEEQQKQQKQQGGGRGDGQGGGGGGDTTVGAGHAGRAAKRRGVHAGADSSGEEMMSPYSLALTRPGAMMATTKPTRRGARRGKPPSSASRSHRHEEATEQPRSAAVENLQRSLQQSERLRTFRLAGHPLRKGVEGDTTAVPALIPIPEGFGDAGEGEEGSYAAGRIMAALRAGQVDAITGRRKRVAVPLWHRATEEASSGAGSVLYSDLIGHTYSVLVGTKRKT